MIQTILQQYLIPALFIITLAVIVRSRREKVQYIISPLAAIAIGFFCYRYDAARYYIAMFFVILLPPAFSFWFIIHPFIAFWRRVGTTLAYSVAFSLMGIMAFGLFRASGFLLETDFGPNLWAVMMGVPAIAFGFFLATQWKQKLKTKTLFGLPELAPQKHPGKLVTDGIYATIRHPRYLEAIVGILGWSLILNYPALYVLTLGVWIAIYLTVLLEEKELRQRWGQEYDDYCKQVPRFIPKRQ